MTTTSKLYHKSLGTVGAGDEVVLTITGNRGVTNALAKVTRTTKTRIHVDGRLFWRTGDHVGDEVGRASQSWRLQYLRPSCHISVVEDADHEARVRAEMDERAKVREAATERARSEKEARDERRAQRFEGQLDHYAKLLDAQAESEIDDRVKEAVKLLASRLAWAVVEIEQNENDVRRSAISRKEGAEEVIDRLDKDHHITMWSNDLEEKVAERKALIEKGKELIYFARKWLGEVDDDES